MLPLLITAWLVLEIWLLVQVGSWLGGLTVVLLLLAGALIGGSLIKRAGAKALSAAIDQSRDPKSQQPQTGTSLTVLAGLLLIVPGFLSDVLALTLLFPPTRALAGRRAALRRQGAAEHLRRRHRPVGRRDAAAGAAAHPPPGRQGDPGRGGRAGRRTGCSQGPDTTYRPPLGG
ncbi:FxsA family protein [Kitasatospora aburaviensis]